ncbi:maltose O-acetyltransferase [Flavobacteriaceae bacterium UJ101]|nr:maltose O-acetyltransferase [Flavobacteriaceae bacterium UJ101]
MKMTEKEKMLQGKPYNTRDPELIQLYHHARKLTLQYNTLDSKDSEKRIEILQNLLGTAGKNIWIETPFHCDYGKLIHIGRNTVVNMNCVFLDDNKIRIGEDCLIAPSVQIYTATHPIKASDRILSNPKPNQASFVTSSKPVTIGNRVWIGGGSIILPGVKIGNNTTIGAGSVVTKNIPDNVLAFGNPCKVVQEL